MEGNHNCYILEARSAALQQFQRKIVDQYPAGVAGAAGVGPEQHQDKKPNPIPS